LQILKKVKEKRFETQVILMTGYTDIKTAVNAMKQGAFDYVGKPINPDELLHTINASLSKKESAPVVVSKNVSSNGQGNSDFVKGVSSSSKQLQEYIDLVAPTNMSVLIIGDSGTGKEYIARSIHNQSKRKDKPFIPVDCGAIPKDLASSEFFGHLKGSFTGAINDKLGHFEVNIRVIAAPNEDLAEAVKHGEFREDLYHRLNEFSIKVPKLSERKDDLMTFAHHFLEKANEDLEKDVARFSPEVIDLFKKYPW